MVELVITDSCPNNCNQSHVFSEITMKEKKIIYIYIVLDIERKPDQYCLPNNTGLVSECRGFSNSSS